MIIYNRTPAEVLTDINPRLENNIKKDLAKDNTPAVKDRVDKI